jgi:hypothetical protein
MLKFIDLGSFEMLKHAKTALMAKYLPKWT